VGEVFPEALEELTNGKGDDDDEQQPTC
jgi:hypothetical protein